MGLKEDAIEPAGCGIRTLARALFGADQERAPPIRGENRSGPTGRASDIEAAAAAWFERREWSHWDANAEQELEAWLEGSTAHRVAYVRLVAVWERAERLKALGAGIPTGQVPARDSFGFTRQAQSTAALDDRTPPTSVGPEEAMPSLVRGTRRRRYGLLIAALVTLPLLGVYWYEAMGRWQSYWHPSGYGLHPLPWQMARESPSTRILGCG